MFYGDFPQENPILITDVTPQAFHKFLDYVYTQDPELHSMNMDILEGVFYLAKKYLMNDMSEVLGQYMDKIANPSNVTSILQMAEFHDDVKLTNSALKVIINQTEKVLSSEDFLSAKIDVVKSILSRPYLKCDEIHVWEGAFNWSKAETERLGLEVIDKNIQKTIAPLLGHIHFLSMHPVVFCNGPAMSGGLTLEQSHSLLMNLTSPNCVPLPTEFSNRRKPRKVYCLENQIPSSVNKQLEQMIKGVLNDSLRQSVINSQQVSR